MPSPHRAHWTLDPEVTFLNHGSYGACPAPVLAAQTEWRARIEREPVLFLGRQLEHHLDDARHALAAFLDADAEDLAFVTNATTGVNTVLESLVLAPGDELLLTDHGYNACKNAAMRVAARAESSVRIASVPFPIRDPDDVLAAILDAVRPTTRLALIDHVTSPTGLVFPIERLIAELERRGVPTLVDGAHAPGMLDLDLGSLGAAYYTGNCHKWLCAPKGAAFLWVRPDLQAGVRPLVISHGANSPRTDRSRFRLEFDWVGTDDPSAILCVPAALRFLDGLYPGGIDELRRRNRERALQARGLLLERLAIPPPAPDSMIGSLASVPLPDAPSDELPLPRESDPLQRALFEHHRIEVPVQYWPAPPARLLRISSQAYNDLDEYRVLAAALSALL